MAIIASTSHKAEVKAVGEAMNASVNFSGALMEMLATVYAYILMSAIREALQNACDASRRAGLSFAEGVMVILPTPSNPVITVIDKGSGMSEKFMTSDYLSFGSSTKAGDNGSAGGLGVGRWAAYGYIRECYIATCHASDMIERTYFQFQGDKATPKVQLAAEVPGTVTGTRVYFPVKESDIQEALFAVAWLKEVMQLTMGDSFSVDTPDALPAVLPAHSKTILELGDHDEGLKGIRIYPMKGTNLQYGKSSLRTGSLVVMTNQEAGVGGLPFHVQAPGATNTSVFHDGMVVEIPLSYNLPFMPSREELKYTDEVTALLKRIDVAAAKAVVAEVTRLYKEPNLESKGKLSDLLGNSEQWHWFSRDVRGAGTLSEPLRAATGGSVWRGALPIQVPDASLLREVQTKFIETDDCILREAYPSCGSMAITSKSAAYQLTFKPNNPIVFVVNDLKTGGQARMRAAAARVRREKQSFLFFSSTIPGAAKAAADSLNSVFGHQAKVLLTSSLPEVARMVVGKRVVSRASGTSLTYYCLRDSKQKHEPMSVTTYNPDEPKRVWIGKEGGALKGLSEDLTLSKLVTSPWDSGGVREVLEALGVNRLYLLSEKQIKEFETVKADLSETELWDALEEDIAEDETSREAFHTVEALKSWTSLEDAVANLVQGPVIQDVFEGREVQSVVENYNMTHLINALREQPRLELTGTAFDKAISPYIDLLNGTNKLHSRARLNPKLSQLCEGLVSYGNSMKLDPDDSKQRQELAATLKHLSTAGKVNYDKIYEGLVEKFPMLGLLSRNFTGEAEGVQHLCRALAYVYK